jgi:hypothetical protein
MNIDGMIAVQDGSVMQIVGFTGADLECEGCHENTNELHETDDSVMLCKPCYEECCKGDL